MTRTGWGRTFGGCIGAVHPLPTFGSVAISASRETSLSSSHSHGRTTSSPPAGTSLRARPRLLPGGAREGWAHNALYLAFSQLSFKLSANKTFKLILNHHKSSWRLGKGTLACRHEKRQFNCLWIAIICCNWPIESQIIYLFIQVHRLVKERKVGTPLFFSLA